MFRFKKAKFTQQQLSSIQLELISFIDNVLVDNLESAKDTQSMIIHHVVVSLTDQMLPLSIIKQRIKKHLPSDGGYIPRGIAFIQSGLDWHFMIAVYKDNVETDITKQVLFSDALTRTKSARITCQTP